MMESLLASINQETTCPVCNKLYQTPISLPCHHTICDVCLQHLKTSEDFKKNRSACCPICSYLLKDLDELKTCKKTELLLETAKTLRLKSSSVSGTFTSQCSSCSIVMTLRHCYHCQKMICNDCERQHKLGILNELKKTMDAAKIRLKAYQDEQKSIDDEYKVLDSEMSLMFKEFHETLDDLEQKMHDVSSNHTSSYADSNDSQTIFTTCESLIENFDNKKEDVSILDMVETNATLNCFLKDLTLEKEADKIFSEQKNRLESLKENCKTCKKLKAELLSISESTRESLLDSTKTSSNSSVKNDDVTNIKKEVEFEVELQKTVTLKDSTYKPRSLFCRSSLRLFVVKELPNHPNILEVHNSHGTNISGHKVLLKTNFGVMNPYQCCYNESRRLLVVTDCFNSVIAMFDDSSWCCIEAKAFVLNDVSNIMEPRGVSCNDDCILLGSRNYLHVLDYKLNVKNKKNFKGFVVIRVSIMRDKAIVTLCHDGRTNIAALNLQTLEHEKNIITTNTFVQSISFLPQCPYFIALLSGSNTNYNEIIFYSCETLKTVKTLKTKDFGIKKPSSLCLLSNVYFLVTDYNTNQMLKFKLILSAKS